MPTIYKDVEVETDVSLDDFDGEDLIEELTKRQLGAHVAIEPDEIVRLAEKVRTDIPTVNTAPPALRELLYQITGKIV